MMRRSSSSDGLEPCPVAGVPPNSRTRPFDATLSTITSGRSARWNTSSGTAQIIATRGAEPMAKLFGACSPIVMCSAVMISRARMVLSAAATPWRSAVDSNSGSSSAAIVGSPSAPRASDAIVMPSWQAARYSSRWAACRRASRARDEPSSASRCGRTETSANSAATKNPLISTSRAIAMRLNVVVLTCWPVVWPLRRRPTGGGHMTRCRGRCYRGERSTDRGPGAPAHRRRRGGRAHQRRSTPSWPRTPSRS